MKITIDKKEETGSITIRAPKKLIDELKKVSKKNKISVNKLVVKILEKALSSGITTSKR